MSAATVPGTVPFDVEREPVLFVVATVHLDSQWRWTIRKTIRDFLPRTLKENFRLFERYPGWVLSFEGAFRYALVKEYYPEAWQELRRWVAAGRWRPAGGMLDAADVNIVAPESLIRHFLYGNGFFERELGVRCRDVFLPDCFGFGQAFPSVAAHCGLAGFSSSKLIKWRGPAGLPFDVAAWQGVDGGRIVAAIRPGGYGEPLREDLSRSVSWRERLEALARQGAPAAAIQYFGTGDKGGAPDPESLEWLARSRDGDGPLRVVPAASDELFRVLAAKDLVRRLPTYEGELLLPTHGSGCYTSQAELKRRNRRCEQAADAAERAAAAAAWLGGLPYPGEDLEASWTRFLWHQMHDDLTGTSIPAAYRFTWNDQAVALNRLRGVLVAAAGAIGRALDTRASGRPVLVFNPLATPREDLVEVLLPDPAPGRPLRVHDPDGHEVPAQILWRGPGRVRLLFAASLPGVGWAVFDVRAAERPCDLETGLEISAGRLENARYRAVLGPEGDLASLFDKRLGRELLAGPARLELLRDESPKWPAWEIRFEDVATPPSAVVAGPPRLRILERGPARVTLEVVRGHGRSTFRQRLSLAAGAAGERLEIDTEIDWATPGRLLKQRFESAAAAPEATYDLGLGVIWRGNNTPERYEVPAQQWADLTAEDGSWGLSILNDGRYGWDKPDDASLRLSLVRSPSTPRRFPHQRWQDFGRHRVRIALAGHRGAWHDGDTIEQAAALNQPLRPFLPQPHPGALGRRWSFLETASPRLAVRALKRAEASDEVVVRLQETRGRAAAKEIVRAAAPVVALRRLNGAEEALEPLPVPSSGRLELSLRPFQLETLALELAAAPPEAALGPPVCSPLHFSGDLRAASAQGERRRQGFDGRGRCFPSELLPPTLLSGGVVFELAGSDDAGPSALTCRGQRLSLPPGFDAVHLLAAAVGGVQRGTLRLGERPVAWEVAEWTGWLARRPELPAWRRLLRRPPRPGRRRTDALAWYATHRHDRRGRDEPYVFCYLFRYRFALAPSARSLTLPDNPAIRLVAATAVRGDAWVEAGWSED